MPSILEQYRISDFLAWNREKRLVLNPNFQRGSVWTPAARTYLIDTILRRLPVPKLFLRTTIDVATKQVIREVVDGQQRLRAILDFADDRFVLSKRAEDLQGFKYSTLREELQESFLAYPIAVDQLLNATDEDVLEVFARLNSYSVQLNAPEKRHARYQGEFKWTVRTLAKQYAIMWERWGILTVRERVRMTDDSLTAEMLGIVLEGVRDGGQPKIDAIYKRYDPVFSPDNGAVAVLVSVLDHFAARIAPDLSGTPLLRPPHLLLLFAALAHARAGIPAGDMGENMPPRDPRVLQDQGIAIANLLELASVVDSEEPPERFEAFWRASKSSTQRIASRRVRFPFYYRALLPQPI